MSKKYKHQQDYDNPFGPTPGTADSRHVQQFMEENNYNSRSSSVYKVLIICIIVIAVVATAFLAIKNNVINLEGIGLKRDKKVATKTEVDPEKTRSQEDKAVGNAHLQMTVDDINKIFADSAYADQGFTFEIGDTVKLTYDSPLGDLVYDGVPYTNDAGNLVLSTEDISFGSLNLPSFALNKLVESLKDGGLPVNLNGEDIEIELDKMVSDDGSKFNHIDFDLANGLVDIYADIGEDSPLRQYLP